MAYGLYARLVRALNNSGIKYNIASGASSRGHGAMGAIQSIMCHHTAGPASGNSPSLNVVTHGRPGLSGPLAQLFLARNGTATLVAAGRAYHAGRVSSSIYQNSHSIGIEAEATGTSSWPDEQIEAYAKLCKALCEEFGLSTSRVVGHKEAAVPRGRKIDPNFNMDDFRQKVGGASGGVGQNVGGGGSSKKYTVVSKTADLGLYDKDGNGHTRIKDWQTDALGYKGKKADGYFGPDTRDDTKALQKQLGLKGKDVDGMVGKTTLAAWEKAGRPKLEKPKPSKPAKPSKSKVKQITVDGKWGREVTTRLQEELGTPVDGEVSFQPAAYKSQNPGLLSGWEWTSNPRSSNVIEALQEALGVTVDGRIGPETICGLQRKLGTPVDGRVSNPSVMVRELQKNLNAGKLW